MSCHPKLGELLSLEQLQTRVISFPTILCTSRYGMRHTAYGIRHRYHQSKAEAAFVCQAKVSPTVFCRTVDPFDLPSLEPGSSRSKKENEENQGTPSPPTRYISLLRGSFKLCLPPLHPCTHTTPLDAVVMVGMAKAGPSSQASCPSFYCYPPASIPCKVLSLFSTSSFPYYPRSSPVRVLRLWIQLLWMEPAREHDVVFVADASDSIALRHNSSEKPVSLPWRSI